MSALFLICPRRACSLSMNGIPNPLVIPRVRAVGPAFRERDRFVVADFPKNSTPTGSRDLFTGISWRTMSVEPACNLIEPSSSAVQRLQSVPQTCLLALAGIAWTTTPPVNTPCHHPCQHPCQHLCQHTLILQRHVKKIR